jgi:hypothetical protein
MQARPRRRVIPIATAKPEPWSQAHGSRPRENAWHRKVCNGALTLRQAPNLERAYKRANG